MKIDKIKILSIKAALIVVSLSILPGCAPIISGAMNIDTTEGEVKAKTAEYFGVAQSKVNISDYSKNTLNTTWKARVGGKLYNCSLYYGNIDCKQPGA
jgi:hypothetical protein